MLDDLVADELHRPRDVGVSHRSGLGAGVNACIAQVADVAGAVFHHAQLPTTTWRVSWTKYSAKRIGGGPNPSRPGRAAGRGLARLHGSRRPLADNLAGSLDEVGEAPPPSPPRAATTSIARMSGSRYVTITSAARARTASTSTPMNAPPRAGDQLPGAIGARGDLEQRGGGVPGLIGVGSSPTRDRHLGDERLGTTVPSSRSGRIATRTRRVSIGMRGPPARARPRDRGVELGGDRVVAAGWWWSAIRRRWRALASASSSCALELGRPGPRRDLTPRARGRPLFPGSAGRSRRSPRRARGSPQRTMPRWAPTSARSPRRCRRPRGTGRTPARGRGRGAYVTATPGPAIPAGEQRVVGAAQRQIGVIRLVTFSQPIARLLQRAVAQ